LANVSEPQRPKEHWIPALVLGGFSSDVDRAKPRDRRLCFRHRHETAPRVTGAKNLAYSRGLYDWDTAEPFAGVDIDMLDDTFNPYERKLPAAFREVQASRNFIHFEPWMRALVPYVAGLTVRAPEYEKRITEGTVGVLVQHSRWMEMSRSVAPLMAADWCLLAAPENARFIINDRGFAWTEDRDNDRVGLLIPIMATHALVVLPRSERLIAGLNSNGCWMTAVPRIQETADGVARANAAIAHDAVSWFAGAEANDVATQNFGQPDLGLAPLGYSWPALGALGSHDRDWAAAAAYAGLTTDKDDWQPSGIFSSIEPGVRREVTPNGLAIQISFLRP